MKVTPTIIIVALAVIIFFSVKGCLDAKKSISSMAHNYAIMQDSAKHWKDKFGQEHATKEVVSGQTKEIRTYYGAQIDSMAELLKIKPKQVKSIVYVPIKASFDLDSLRDALARIDTLRTTDTLHTVDTIHGKMDVNALMSLTRYSKGTGFLGLKKRNFMDVHFDNPVFKPLDVSGFDITDKVKHWSIGPYAGYGWNGDRWAPQVGMSIQYSILKF